VPAAAIERITVSLELAAGGARSRLGGGVMRSNRREPAGALHVFPRDILAGCSAQQASNSQCRCAAPSQSTPAWKRPWSPRSSGWQRNYGGAQRAG
jgi:hypothetical protein